MKTLYQNMHVHYFITAKLLHYNHLPLFKIHLKILKKNLNYFFIFILELKIKHTY